MGIFAQDLRARLTGGQTIQDKCIEEAFDSLLHTNDEKAITFINEIQVSVISMQEKTGIMLDTLFISKDVLCAIHEYSKKVNQFWVDWDTYDCIRIDGYKVLTATGTGVIKAAFLGGAA